MSKVRFGVLGVGTIFHMGHRHAYRAIEEAELAVVCDANETLGRKIAEEFGATYTPHVEDVLNDASLDAVDVSLPTRSHAAMTIAAAQAGKHVICEKPLGMTLAECDQMVQVCEQAGVKLMTAENYIFAPDVLEIKRLLDEGKLGTLREVRVTQGWSGPMRKWSYAKAASGGGVMFDDGVHFTSLAMHLLGDPIAVSGTVGTGIKQRVIDGETVTAEVEDYGAFTVQFANNALAILQGSWLLNPGMFSIEVNGDLGTAIMSAPGWMDGDFKVITMEPDAQGALTPQVRISRPMPRFPSPESYINEFRHFVDCIQHDTTPIFAGKDGRRAMEIIFAGYESSASGRVVSLAPSGEALV